MAAAIPASASTLPTERSIPEVRMTSVIPVASVRFTQTCRDRFDRFRAVRNAPPLSQWKIAAVASTASNGRNVRRRPRQSRSEAGTVSPGTVGNVLVDSIGYPFRRPRGELHHLLLRQPIVHELARALPL